MRLLQVYTGENGYGGIESLLMTLLGLNDDKLESLVALYVDDRFAERLRAAGVNPHLVGGGAHLRNPLSVLSARRQFATLLRKERIDVVVFHNSLAWLWTILAPAVKRARVPLAIWFHDPFPQEHWLDRLARFTRPDFLLFSSEAAQSRLTPLYPHLANTIVYPPVEPPRNLKCRRSETRIELGAAADSVAVLHAGRMVPGKGHALLFEALNRLRDLTGWVCWLAGAPQTLPEREYFDSLKRKVAEFGIAERVKFLGYYADSARLYAAADIYCQPNVSLEPFGLAFIEALYARLPCVATAGSGGPERILDEGCGVIVPPNYPNALASALAQLIGDHELRERLGANGPTRARQLCDPTRQMAKLRAVMMEACPRLRGSAEAAMS